MAATRARVALVGIACTALVAALIIGIGDNPPGLALMYGSVVCLLVTAVWRWRRPRCFFLLFALSVVGFITFAVLHNLFYAIGKATTAAWIRAGMEALHVVSFLVAVMVCPPAVLVGLVGWIIALVRDRERASAATG